MELFIISKLNGPGCLFIFLFFIVPLSQRHLRFLEVFSQPLHSLSSPAQRKAQADTGRRAGPGRLGQPRAHPTLSLCTQVGAQVGTAEAQRKDTYLSPGKLGRCPKPVLLKLKCEGASLGGLVNADSASTGLGEAWESDFLMRCQVMLAQGPHVGERGPRTGEETQQGSVSHPDSSWVFSSNGGLAPVSGDELQILWRGGLGDYPRMAGEKRGAHEGSGKAG